MALAATVLTSLACAAGPSPSTTPPPSPVLHAPAPPVARAALLPLTTSYEGRCGFLHSDPSGAPVLFEDLGGGGVYVNLGAGDRVLDVSPSGSGYEGDSGAVRVSVTEARGKRKVVLTLDGRTEPVDTRVKQQPCA